MSAPTSPADLYRHSLRLLLDKNIPGWVGLWAENGVMQFPFAPKGWPERLDGKEAIAAYMRHYPDHIDLHDVPDLRIHETADPRPSWSRCAASAAWWRPAARST
jgi:ketosteroid isomerase-like protein